MDLNFQQRRHLRKTGKKKGITYESPTYDPIADYLEKLEYVGIVTYDSNDDYMQNIRITEKGKAYLSDYFDRKTRANIAIALSILSFLISFASLVVSVIALISK